METDKLTIFSKSKMTSFELTDKPTNETINWLISRPWWTSHHHQLQNYLYNLIHDTHLVACPGDTLVAKSFLLTGGQIKLIKSQNDIKLKKMEQSQCHINSLKLFKKGKINEMHTGYALSQDGLWRYHSWGLKNNKVIETTEPRIAYFSIMIIK